MPKVSIIIPLYNKAPYITKALDSVLAQTYTDYECIIVNDGSTDQSEQVVHDWLKLRSKREEVRFRLIEQANAGVSAARNRGVRESERESEFVTFLDADDWWCPTFLGEMVKLTEAYPDAALYASNYIYYKPGKTRVGVRQVYDLQGTMHNEDGWSGYVNYPKSYYENGEQVVWTGAVMINRSRLQDVDDRLQKKGEYFDPQVKLGEDFLLWLRLSLRYKVAFLNKPLAYYNNDVPAQLRLTCNLHRPEANMLWHIDDLFVLYTSSVKDGVVDIIPLSDWKMLFDKLRLSGLREYWLSSTYHEAAAQELRKVSACAIDRYYSRPFWYLHVKRHIMQCGSYIKSQCRKLI